MSEQLNRLWGVCDLLGAALMLTSSDETRIGRDSVTHSSRPRLLAVVKPAPTALRWRSRRERLQHGTTLASCDLQTRPVIEDAAGVLLEVLAPVLAELERRDAA